MEKLINGFAIYLACASFFLIFVDCSIDLSNVDFNDLQQQLPPEFANPNETLNNARTMVRDKCIKVAGQEKGTEAYNEIEMSVLLMGECLTTIVNFTAIQTEIDEASPRGELDIVFNKYCNRRPEALQCIEDFNSKLLPCLDNEERESQEVFMRIVRSLLNFICHKGGDQIALFIAEKGPECLESKKDDIQQCINSTFSHYVPKDGFEDMKTLPKFVLSDEQCQDIIRLEACIVEKLESCTEITPANIVESMFRFIKNETICRNTPNLLRQRSNSATNLMISFNLLALLITFGLYHKLTKLFQ